MSSFDNDPKLSAHNLQGVTPCADLEHFRVETAFAFTLPALAFASLFRFRFVDDPGTATTRLILTAVAASAGLAAVAGARQAKLAAPLVGRTAACTLVVVDVMMVVGAVFGASDVIRDDAPHSTGWIIDVAAIGWVGASVSVVRRIRHGRL